MSTHLSTGVKSLGSVSVRASASLVQPTVTADTYVINQQRLYDIAGTPQDPDAGSLVFNSLPGVTNGSVRGGAFNDVGIQLEGVDITDINSGTSVLTRTLNGAHSLELSTGGYDVTNGNANSGVLNEIINHGTYPAGGQATFRVGDPVYDHEISLDYGGASPNNRLSYYIAISGIRQADAYGDTTTLLPLTLGWGVFNSINDSIVNLFYHFGQGNRNELQFLTDINAVTFTNNHLAYPPDAPYASNNGNVEAAGDPFGFGQPPTFRSNYISFIPGQAAYQQNTGVADSFTANSFVDELNFKRQMSPSSFVLARAFKTYGNAVSWAPYGGGSFHDGYGNWNTTALGGALDYTNQISAKHELGFGGQGIFYHTNYLQLYPTSGQMFAEPLEDLGCPSLAHYLAANAGLPGFPQRTTSGVGGCYIAPFNNAINNAFVARGFPNPGLPTDPLHAPLSGYVDSAFYTQGGIHRWDVYIKDRWQPNQRLTVSLGLRWDKESIGMPSNTAELNTSYYFDTNGDVVTTPGKPLGPDVTQPQQISPRMAASYELTARDAVRFSYGKNIQFVPLVALETIYHPPTSLQNCNLSNGCFIPLPGGPTTPTCCTNHITNLYQQVLVDLNTNIAPQYTPVLPETAVNLDFSYEHEFGQGIELRVTPYYRKSKNYAVYTQSLLFTLPNGTPEYYPTNTLSGGINENTGIELAVQRSATYGFSGSLAATYNNTLANYDSNFFPSANLAALAVGHFYRVTYVAPLSGALNVVYNSHKGLYAATTISYESGFRYGVGTKTFVFGVYGQPEQVLNTDLVSGTSNAYYFTDPANPGTIEHPNITGSRGTREGSDPGTLFGPPIAVVNLTVSQELGRAHDVQAGIRVVNLFGNYSPGAPSTNQWYVPQGMGGYGPGSGVNGNQCAPGQTLGCEPFSYNQSAFPYEAEPNGPPRVYTFFVSVKY